MKKLLVFLFAVALMLGIGTQAKAATSAINNLPGGAGILQWMAAPDGTHTLVNIQNTGNCGAIAVHITFYDYNSNHLFDIRWPMSSLDNVGLAVTGDGTNVYLEFEPGEGPTMPVEGGLVHNHLFSLAGVGAGNLQYGYMTVAVDALDTPAVNNCYVTLPAAGIRMAAGNGNGNPLDDTSGANNWVVLPDLLVARAAILFPNGVLGMNGQMLQGFMNMPRLDETGASFVNVRGADASCIGNNVNWDGDSNNAEITNVNDNGGVNIQAHELYVTLNNVLFAGNNGQIALFPAAAGAAACNANGRVVALGSNNNSFLAAVTSGYWARYNVANGFTDTNLVLVFPANNGNADNPTNLVADRRDFSGAPFNDNEQFVSIPTVRGPEVTIAPFASATNPALPGQPVIAHTTYTNGEFRLVTRAPLFGYTFTTVNGVGADIYPIVPERIAVNQQNLSGADIAQDIVLLP